jgi:hypothetical protein
MNLDFTTILRLNDTFSLEIFSGQRPVKTVVSGKILENSSINGSQ